MQKLVKLIRNSLYGEKMRRDFMEKWKSKSENLKSTENYERILDYEISPNREYIVEKKLDNGLECETDFRKTMPVQLGIFNWNNIKRNMNKFICEFDVFKTNNVFFSNTDSLCVEVKLWDLLDKT